MKEIDFLPEWYTEGRRRRAQMRRQYAALAFIFLGMMAYNLTSSHRIGRVSAELTRLEDRQILAESVTRRFGMISDELGRHQAKANLLKQMDSRIDPAAVAAEISHLMGMHVVLSRVELVSEPVRRKDTAAKAKGSAVRAAVRSGSATKSAPLGDVKFRVVLAGAAASAGDVGALVCRLDESSYFRQVHPSYSRNSSIQVVDSPSPRTGSDGPTTPSTAPKRVFQVSEFEITCYLANFEEVENG